MSDELTVVHLLRHGEVHNPAGRALRPAARLSPLRPRPARWPSGSPSTCAGATSPTSSSSPLERAQETARPGGARRSGSPVAIDDRLIEAGNVFEGKTFGVGDGVAAQAVGTGSTCATRSGRRGASRTARSPRGCSPRSPRRRDAARGHEALLRQPPAADLDGAARSRPAAGSGTTRASGSARSRRSRPSPTAATSWSRCPTSSRPATCVPGAGRQEVRRRRVMTAARPRPTASPHRPAPALRRVAAVALAGCSGAVGDTRSAGQGLHLGRRHRDGHRRRQARRTAGKFAGTTLDGARVRRRRPPRATSSW